MAYKHFARSATESAHPNRWQGLRGLWVPELGVTGDTLFDWSGYKSHGALNGMDQATDWVIGDEKYNRGYSLDFDASDDNVSIGDLSPLKITGAMTLVCLMNTGTDLNGTDIFGKYKASSNQRGYLLLMKFGAVDGFLTWTVQQNAASFTVGQQAHTTNEFADGNWHLVIGTYEPSNILDIWVDGVLEGSGDAATSCADVTEPMRMSGASTYAGKLGMCAMFARCFRPREIREWTEDPYGLLRPRSRVKGNAPITMDMWYQPMSMPPDNNTLEVVAY